MRMNLQRRLFVSIAIWQLTACASSPFDGSYTDLVEQDLKDIADRDRMLLARSERGRSIPLSSDQELSADSVEAYVQLALDRNPALRAAEQRVLRLNERIPQVTSLDDPMLEVVPIGEMAETAAGQVGVMTGVSQRLPFPGKLDARGRIAEHDVAIAEQELARERLTVISETRQSYWSLYYAARAIELTNESRHLLTQMRDAAQAKYRAGTTTQETVLRASVELNNLDNELIRWQQRRATAVAMLNMLIDQPVNASLPDPEPIGLSAFEARLDDLLAGAARSNPSIQAIRERIEQYHEQRELARLGYYPDLTVSVSYNLVDSEGLSPVSNGDDQWWIGFGINLPIWQDRRAAAQREATRGILETSGSLADEQNRIAFRIQDAYVRVEAQQQQAALLRDAIIPEARRAVEASFSGYRAGEVEFLTLVDNWRKLLDFQLMEQASLTELERSMAELQEAVGHDLHRSHATQSEDLTSASNSSTHFEEDE